MNLKMVFTLQAIVALFFGLALISAPTWLLSQYGVTAHYDGLILSRLFGAALLTICFVCLYMSREPDSATLTAVTKALCFGSALALLVHLHQQLTTTIGPLGWFSVVLFACFTAGYARFAFSKVPSVQAESHSS